MIKMELDEFMEEVKMEMAGYEEITQEDIEKWEDKVRDYIKEGKKNRITKKGNSTFVKLDDESDFFKIVDQYFAAIVNEETEKYWTDFSL